MGFIADRVPRKWGLIFFSFLWSVASFVQAFANSFLAILLPRIFMEICLAATFPFSYSLISDSFPPEYWGRASAVYTLGLYLGVAMSSISLVFIGLIGWWITYMIVSGLSLLCCAQILLIKEPRRGRYNTKDQIENAEEVKTTFWATFKILFSSATFVVLVFASALRYFGGYSIGFWGA